MRAFIDDGYTTNGHVKAVENCHEAVDFTFRPATTREFQGWLSEREKLKGNQGSQCDAEFAASHLVNWSILDSKDQAVLITANNFLRLHPRVSSAIINQISGDGVRVPDKGN